MLSNSGRRSTPAGTVLGFDTATRATAVAVVAEDGRHRAACREPGPAGRPGHASELLELVETVIAEAQVDWSELTLIAVGLGPGGFTGLRIGVATARALAQARALPVAGVGTLEVLAAGALSVTADPTLVLTDAGRREFFAGAWRSDETAGTAQDVADARPLALMDPVALSAEAVAAALGDLPGGLRAVGPGAVQLRGSLEAAGVVVPVDASRLHRVDAEQLCQLAATTTPIDRDRLVPHYGRAPDARPRWAGLSR